MAGWFLTSEHIRLGAVGLGRGFALTARALAEHPGIAMVAAATRSVEARTAFERDFGGHSFADYADLLGSDTVEMIYVSTPHGLHHHHVIAALQAGKHVVVEKPLAVSVTEAEAMVNAAQHSGLQLLVGPSHSYDPPIALAAEIITSGRVGRPRLLNGLMATDFIYRPRRPEELRTQEGGGVVFSQAIHHVDVAMRLLGQPIAVQAMTGAWDQERPTEGAYSALIRFEGGATASLTYSGYGYFDSDVWMGEISELGHTKKTDQPGRARRKLAKITDEATYKKTRAFAGLDALPSPEHHEHFGPLVVFCDHGDLRLTPDGVVLYSDEGVEEIPAPFRCPRQGFAQALVDALRGGPSPVQTGAWGLTALRTCHAILKSAETQATVKIAEVANA